MEFKERVPNITNVVSDFYQNQVMGYLKFALYGTDDKKVVEEKELALKELMAGIQEMGKKNFETAQGFMSKALNIFTSNKDDLHTAFSEFFLGEVSRMKEDFATAQERYQKALDIFSSQKNRMASEVEEKIKEVKASAKAKKEEN